MKAGRRTTDARDEQKPARAYLQSTLRTLKSLIYSNATATDKLLLALHWRSVSAVPGI